MPTRSVDWYFDFISPFAYLALARLDALGPEVQIRYRPVLFAGLLKHWDNKGPAEIAPKRLWTYRWCTWQALEHGIPFRFPAAHPFNPLPYLRLAIAADCEPGAVRRIFDVLWTTGEDPTDPERVQDLATELGIELAGIDYEEVKARLREETAQAAARGVFGVPTLAIDGELFWGVDAIDFARAFLSDRSVLDNPEMQRLAALPVAATRRL
jgi:2-hydroxychromene-2-carboxylate isomerase